MRDDLKYPSTEAVISVLTKLGINPESRHMDCQDIEYTSCKLDELEAYIELYEKNDTSIYEKRVLGCYFLQCLHEYIGIYNQEHSLQNKAFGLLFSDIDIHIHKTELEYFSDTTHSPNEDDWWHVTKPILNWNNKSFSD